VILLTLLIIVGSLVTGALVYAIYFKTHKSAGNKTAPPVPIPVFVDCSPYEVSKQMVGFARRGHFLMHTLINNAPPFDDGAFLTKYKAYIKKPSVITFIQNIKGESEYE
jgi:hypothetical protein